MSIIRADSIKNRAGNGAPDFPNGITVTGVVTSTSISQNITGNLTVSGNLGVGGTITYEDVTNVDSVGIITARSGIQIGAGGTVGSSGGGIVTYFGDGSQLLNITSVGGATGADFNDNVKVRLGTGNDFELFFDGTVGQIKGIAGVQGINVATSNVERYQFTDGSIRPLANNTYDLGTSSLRWKDIYTQDLQLSNEAKKDEGGNDVDGTWGDWTLQEGENDIFMINNRNGKKYKINLTEV